MKSLTIHMDEALDRRVREKAASEGVSLNRTVTRVLRDALGLNPKSNRAQFEDHIGVWSEEEKREFDALTRRDVDPRDWQ